MFLDSYSHSHLLFLSSNLLYPFFFSPFFPSVLCHHFCFLITILISMKIEIGFSDLKWIINLQCFVVFHKIKLPLKGLTRIIRDQSTWNHLCRTHLSLSPTHYLAKNSWTHFDIHTKYSWNSSPLTIPPPQNWTADILHQQPSRIKKKRDVYRWNLSCLSTKTGETEANKPWAGPCIEASIYAGATAQDPCPCVYDPIGGNESLVSRARRSVSQRDVEVLHVRNVEVPIGGSTSL